MMFTKMQGLGNDFIMVDCFDIDMECVLDIGDRKTVQKLCDRHFGIGADGVILILPSDNSDFRMRIFNPDGSEAEMCGNGIRCFAKFVYDLGITKEKTFTVETLAGIIKPRIVEKGIMVDMGEPKVGDIGFNLTANEKTYQITEVSMGNPHAVIFVDNAEDYPVSDEGAAIETNKRFPNKTNVEFVEVVNDSEIIMRVWERGAGITLACGTGACASVVAGALNKKTGRNVTVHLLGGDLDIEWAADNHVYMTGPAEFVFDGKIEV